MKLHRLIENACAIASEDIGKAKADRIAMAAQRRYEELCAENASDSKAQRAHTYKRIYPSIAVYEAMRAEGVDADRATWYIREHFQRTTSKVVPHLQRLIKGLGLAKKTPTIFMKMVVRFFPAEAGFVYDIPDAHGNEARFNMMRCPYFDTCTRYGCPEITVAFCDSDDMTYGNMHPKLRWGRTKTIGRGAECCDFLLQYRE